MNLKNILEKSAPIVLGASLLLASACDGLKDKVLKICRENYKWTEQQCATAYSEGLKVNYMRNVAEDADKGGRKFEVNYGTLPLDDILEREKTLLEMYRDFLDPNDRGNSRFLDDVGTREIVLEEFLVREQRVKWMTFAKTLRSFLKEMGYSASTDSNQSEDRLSYGELVKRSVKSKEEKGAYHVRLVSPFEKLDPVELFSVSVIEAARKKGKLETVQSFRFPFYEQVQVQNPEKPNDPNSKIWEHRIRGIEVKAYDVDGDKDKKPDYVAVFKMEGKYKDGKLVFENPSETPSIQIFKSPGSSNPNLIVIDKDGDTIPDEVNKIFGVNTASDLLFSKKAETLDRLFSERGKDPEEEIAEFRKGYHLPKQSFGVAMVGETKIEEFRINDSGWPLPQFKYKNSQGSNYKVEIVLGGSHHENDSKENPYREIKYFKKVYHSPNNQYQDVEGKVVEYFKPPKEYSDKDVREAKVEGTNNQTISIHRKGKTNETWHIDDILKGSSAFAIEYDSGDKREIIVDKDGDKEKDSRYEAKKLFTPGKDKVPVITSPEGGYE